MRFVRSHCTIIYSLVAKLKRKIKDITQQIEEMEKNESARRALWEKQCEQLQREYESVKVCYHAFL